MKIDNFPSFELFIQLINANIFKLFSSSLDVPGIKYILINTMKDAYGLDEKFWGKELKKFCGGREGIKPSEIEKEMTRLWGTSSLFTSLQAKKGATDDVKTRKNKETNVSFGKKIPVTKTGNRRRNGK